MLQAKAPTFFVDERLDSKRFVDILESGGLQVVRHRDIFEKGISDEVWIKKVSEKGLLAFTYDNQIARNENQTKLVMDCHLGLFILRSKNSTSAEKGQFVIHNMAKLHHFIEENHRPFIASITRSDVRGRRPKDRQ